MGLNLANAICMLSARVHRTKNAIRLGQSLETVNHQLYLGVILLKRASSTCKKIPSYRSLGFIKRNLHYKLLFYATVFPRVYSRHWILRAHLFPSGDSRGPFSSS